MDIEYTDTRHGNSKPLGQITGLIYDVVNGVGVFETEEGYKLTIRLFPSRMALQMAPIPSPNITGLKFGPGDF